MVALGDLSNRSVPNRELQQQGKSNNPTVRPVQQSPTRQQGSVPNREAELRNPQQKVCPTEGVSNRIGPQSWFRDTHIGRQNPPLQHGVCPHPGVQAVALGSAFHLVRMFDLAPPSGRVALSERFPRLELWAELCSPFVGAQNKGLSPRLWPTDLSEQNHRKPYLRIFAPFGPVPNF